MIYRSCAMVLVRLCWLLISLTKTWELVGTTKYAQSVAVGQTTDWRWCSAATAVTLIIAGVVAGPHIYQSGQSYTVCVVSARLYILHACSAHLSWRLERELKKGKFSWKKRPNTPKVGPLCLARKNICPSQSVCGPATPALHHLLFATPERVELQKFCLKNNEIRGNS